MSFKIPLELRVSFEEESVLKILAVMEYLHSGLFDVETLNRRGTGVDRITPPPLSAH